ncbi:MAG: hypothetical protein ACI9R3_003289, partial [Verrucomicrobiales bacterium]
MDNSESLDLSQLHLTPDWVKQAPETNKYADYKGEERGGRGRHDGGGRGNFGGGGGGGQNRGPRRDGPGGPGGGRPPGDRDRRDNRAPGAKGPGPGPGGPGAREQGGGGRPGGNDRRGPGGGNRPGGPGGPGGGNRQGGGDRRGGGQFRGGRGRDRDQFREPLLDGIEVRFIPETPGVESLARQIKATGRAYSVFDLAKLVLGGRERYAVEFVRTKEAPDSLYFFQCKLDQSLWLSKEEALRHALDAKGLEEYYLAEDVETEGPKGNFTVIAVCGMSGVLLGPPNHHDYQRDLTRLHQERFANMHIEGFKRRIRMEKDEETIAKWKAEKSKETHYTYQKTAEGADPVILKSTAEMERHCREHHLDDFVAEAKAAKVPGTIPAKGLAAPLLAHLRNELEQQKRFPMNTVKGLCRQLEDQGLKFFKDEDGKKKKTTYVCRSRPRALQGASGLSDRIRKIVGMVRDNPGIDYALVVSNMLPGQKLSTATTNAAKKSTDARKGQSGKAKAEAKSPQPQQRKISELAEPAKVTEPTPETQTAAVSEPETAPTPTPVTASEKTEPTTTPAAVESTPESPAISTPEAKTAPAPKPEEVAKPAESHTETATASQSDQAPAAAPDTKQKAEVKTETAAPASQAPASQAPASQAPASETAAEAPIEGPSEAEIGILKDLRWLIREGYVVEYSSGAMRLARNSPPKKRPAKKKKTAKPATAEGGKPGAPAAPSDGTPAKAATSPPAASPPAASPPVASPPVASPPVASPPVASPPVASPPVASPPVASPPVASPPVAS